MACEAPLCAFHSASGGRSDVSYGRHEGRHPGGGLILVQGQVLEDRVAVRPGLRRREHRRRELLLRQADVARAGRAARAESGT